MIRSTNNQHIRIEFILEELSKVHWCQRFIRIHRDDIDLTVVEDGTVLPPGTLSPTALSVRVAGKDTQHITPT